LQPDVVAITGSVGKTSTKNAIATVLKQQFAVVASQGNLNTVLGLALTILNTSFDADTKLVLEMGACKEGDIAELCSYFRPNFSVVTNVHGVHLETFGSVEMVAQTKGEIIEALNPVGVACLNADDARVRSMKTRHSGRVIFYGLDSGSNVGPDSISVTLPLLGKHAIYNALAACAVGQALGMDSSAINQGLLALQPEKGRLYRLPGIHNTTLIDDSYNASPASTEAALDVLQEQATARSIAFLGDMLELGEESLMAHVNIIRRASQQADRVFVVGECMNAALSRVPSDQKRNITNYNSSLEAVSAIGKEGGFTPLPGDTVLVKGSQSVRMEKISRALLHPTISSSSVLPRQSCPGSRFEEQRHRVASKSSKDKWKKGQGSPFPRSTRDLSRAIPIRFVLSLSCTVQD